MKSYEIKKIDINTIAFVIVKPVTKNKVFSIIGNINNEGKINDLSKQAMLKTIKKIIKGCWHNSPKIIEDKKMKLIK